MRSRLPRLDSSRGTAGIKHSHNQMLLLCQSTEKLRDLAQSALRSVKPRPACVLLLAPMAVSSPVESSMECSTFESMPARLRLLFRHRVGLPTVPGYLLQSSGFLIRGCRRSLWIHGETAAQFDAARRLIHDAMQDRPHVRLVLTSANPAAVEYLRASFPDDMACPLPWDFGPALGRFLTRVKPGMLLLLDGGRSLGPRMLNAVTTRGIAVASVNIGRAESVGWHLLEAARSAAADMVFCVHNIDCALALHNLGIRPGQLFATGALDLERGRPSQQVRGETLRALVGASDQSSSAPVFANKKKRWCWTPLREFVKRGPART
jgi:hypothetical protein